MMRGIRYMLPATFGLAVIGAVFAASCRREGTDLPPDVTTPKDATDVTSATDATDAGEATDAPPRVVSFPTSDGGLIYAHEYGHGDHGVVLAHGGRFNKESWGAQARVLAEAQFRVLAIDFRGYGQSRGGAQPADHDDRHYVDVLAAVRYLRESGAKTVSVIGASFGGGVAARAAVEAEPQEIDRLVLMAHSAIEHPERMQGRKLFITTRGDFSGSGTLRLPGIRDQYERAQEPKELVILEGTAHAQHIFKTDQADRLMHEIQRFLSEP